MSLKTTIVTDSICDRKKLIQCVCEDSSYAPGELLIQCKVCERWLHEECLGLDRQDDKPNEFVCVFCGTAILVVQCNCGEEIKNVPVLHEESDHILCCCDEQNESGFMIQCEHCLTWQHGKCMGLKKGENPTNYLCHICRFASSKFIIESPKLTKEIIQSKEENGKGEMEIEQGEASIKMKEKEKYSYTCRICGVEFENGRALIYHNSYEKCKTKNVKIPQENSSISHQIEKSAKNYPDKNIPLESFWKKKSPETNGNRKGNDPKEQPCTKSILDDALSTKECSITDLNHRSQSDANDSKGNDHRDKAIVISTTRSRRNNHKTKVDNIETIRDVNITQLQSDLDISSTSEDISTECSLAFPDMKSLKTHSQCNPNSKPIHHTKEVVSQEEEDIINCLCGSDVETGLMVQCEICLTWQHAVCIGLSKRQTLPASYFCFDCMNRGCFSIILELSNVTVENIAEKFHQKFVGRGRKRKISQSSFTTKRRKQSQDSSVYTDESEEFDSLSEDSLLDESYETLKINKLKRVRPRVTKDFLSRPLVRSSVSELSAMKHLLSTILSKTRIFTHLRPCISNFKRLTFAEVLELLPTPMDFPSIEITSDLNETVHTTSINYLSSANYPYGTQLIINVGAPVTCLAWVPAVFNTDNAIYLAITTQRSVACKDHLFSIPPVEIDSQTSDIVQIWSICGHSQFDSEVRIAMGLILKQGKVMDMQWCPSGCFDEVTHDVASTPRLGLLLVAMNTGELGIISVPHPGKLNKPETQSSNWFDDQFYEVKGFDLTLGLEDGPHPDGCNKCLCCDWSLQNNHGRIVAGFQNGVVAVWNLKSKLFCKNSKLRPILMIKAHTNPVISVVWSPQHPYLFATASHDMYTTLIWDMRQAQVHSTDMNSTQVCVTWCVCWPINYLRPVCGIEVIPRKNEFSWYGNLFTNSFRTIGTLYRHQLGGHYQQCPTISSLDWCRKNCSLLLGSFSGELLFLYSFHSCNKTKLRTTQARKLIDISIRSDEEYNKLNMNPFDIKRINAVTIDFNFSSFRHEETFREFKCAEVSQVTLVKRLMKPDSPKKSSSGKFTGECKKCGKKFTTKYSIDYHRKHNVCKNGSVLDNRGNFFGTTMRVCENDADQLMLQQLKSQKNSKQIITSFKDKYISKSQAKLNTTAGTSDSSPRCSTREKPPDKYQECSHSQIKQVKWFPCEPYQNVFAVGTGLGLITISYLPET